MKKLLNKFFWFKEGNRLIVGYDKEGRTIVAEIEFSGDYELDKKTLKKFNFEKIIKKVYLNELEKKILQFKADNDFLKHFFDLMAQGWSVVEGNFIYNLGDVLQKYMEVDIKYFEFWRYLYQNYKFKAKKLAEILENIRWFESYIDYLNIFEDLPDKSKPLLFQKLKEKIEKEERIKREIISPLIQPTILFFILILMYVVFSQWMLKDIITNFYSLWLIDKIPSFVPFTFNIWNFISTNYLDIIYFILSSIIILIFLKTIFTDTFQKILLNFDFYKLFNEYFVGFILKLQSFNYDTWKVTFSEILDKIAKSYKNNKYYHFLFNLLYTYKKKWMEDQVPLSKYQYIITIPFRQKIEEIIMTQNFHLIDSYLKIAENNIKNYIGKIKSMLNLISLLTLAIWIWILFLAMILGNQSKTDMIKKQAEGWNSVTLYKFE